jgi:GAF domain-containing protein
MARQSEPSQLTRLLVHTDGGAALLGRLHEHLLEAAGGVASLVVHLDSVTGCMRASSASGVTDLPLDPWYATPAEREPVDRALALGHVIPVELTPDSRPGQLLATRAGLVVPVAGSEGPCAVVYVGFGEQAPAGPDEERVLAVADAFVLALERGRMRRAADLQRDVERLVNAFRAEASTWSDLNVALATGCRSAARLFAADRAAVWLHDRRARELVLAASSEGGHGPQAARVAVVDSLSRPASALRASSPELASDAGPGNSPTSLLVPLRGRRRALGVLELEGVHIEPGDEGQVLEASATLGHELAAAIETLLLLHQTIRAEGELARLFDTLADLVIVCDAEYRVLRSTPGFAVRAGVSLPDLAGSELSDLFGDAVLARLREASSRGSGPFRVTFHSEGSVAGNGFTFDASPLHAEDGAHAGVVLVVHELPAASPGAAGSSDRG